MEMTAGIVLLAVMYCICEFVNDFYQHYKNLDNSE